MAVVLAVCVAASATAVAGTSLKYRVENRTQKGKSRPKLILRPDGALESGTVRFERSDGKTRTVQFGAVGAGEREVVPIEQPTGTYSWTIEVEATTADGGTVESTIETDVTWVERLELSVVEEHVDLADGELSIRSNRPVARVETEIQSADGELLHRRERKLDGRREFEVSWPVEQDVGAIRLKAYDRHGFWRGLLLEPFWVKIPHKEVEFHFGKATWKSSEASKLRSSLERIREAMQKHADKGLQMKLFIAGYTDTVGSKASNRKLSRRRARAIGNWFREHGLQIPVYYQGFGEDVLAVETPDETRKAANRRALYILGNAMPPTSESIPSSDWRPLQ
ncbi:MAG: OmpA family protein [Bradymonadaceae bacterium]